MTAMILAHHYRRIQSPESKVIRRPIPGSYITVVFNVSKDFRGRVSVQAKVTEAETLKKELHKIPIESFYRSAPCSFGNALKALSEIAVDYVCGNIIFLSNVSKLIREWKDKKTAKHPEAKQNPAAYMMHLEDCSLRLAGNPTEETIDAYHCFGNEYYYRDEYENALSFFHKMYLTALDIPDLEGIRLAHDGFAFAYHALGENKRAISHCHTQLGLGVILYVDAFETAKIYLLLGNIYQSKGENRSALAFYKLFKNYVKIELKPGYELSLAYSSMGNAYLDQENYPCAEKNFEKSLQIDSENFRALNGLGTVYKKQGYYKKAITKFQAALENISIRSDTGRIHNQLGLTYLKLGENSLAEYHFEEDLAIAEETKNCESLARAHYNLAGYWIGQNDLEKGPNYILSALSFAKQLEDHQLAGMIYGLLGHCYFESDQKKEAIEAHKKHLELACEKEDLDGQITARNNLGKTYTFMDKFSEADTEFRTALVIAINAGDLEALTCLYHNLGRNYHYWKDQTKEIEYYELAIAANSKLIEENCHDNLQWQISLFESLFRPLRCLEETTLQTNTNEALRIADSSRSKALLMCLEKRLGSQTKQNLSVDEILNVAATLKTTLVVYSCDPFDDAQAWCWVINPEKNIECRKLDITKSLNEIPLPENHMPSSQEGPEPEEIKGEKIRGSFSQWIMEVERGVFRGLNDVAQPLPYELEQLKKWYTDFILPIEDLIPKNGERITFIPDAYLHEAPFALFLNDQGKFLFETCTPCNAPSIKALLYIDQLSKKNSSSRAHGTLCRVACPTPHEDFDLKKLTGVTIENESAAKFFKSSFEVNPMVEEVKGSLNKAGNIHIACHGKSKEKENVHSVFEGALALTDPRPLYAEDIVHLDLNAELAFLSACSSGKGKKFKEGSIGLPFAFLAGGTSSVIATHWNIYDLVTPIIVENFYQHYLGLSVEAQIARFEGKPFGQAEALRHAMLFGKNKYPDKPKVWGAFFMTGLPGDIFQHDPVPDTEHSKPVIWENPHHKLLFTLKDGKIITTLLDKKSGEERDIEENRITACMKDVVQVKGNKQDKRSLDRLQLEEKEQVINFVVFRVIEIKEKEIHITSRLRS